MKEIRELYGQAWSLYGGSSDCLFGGILAILLGSFAGVAPFWFVTNLFAIYCVLHALVQVYFLFVKHEGIPMEIRAEMMVLAARMMYFFMGFTLANNLLVIYVTHFQPVA